jgi:hypothetical protein
MRCKALTKKKTPCSIDVEDFRKNGLCHVHDPNGKFKIQQRNKGWQDHTVIGVCDHKWYMREKGIQCDKCLVIWQNEDVNQ